MAKKKKGQNHKRILFLVFDISLAFMIVYALGLMAASNTNPAIKCSIMPSAAEKDVCYIELAESTKDSSHCSKVIDDYRRDICYIGFTVYDDFSVCSQILDQDLYITCVRLSEAPQ